MKVRQMLDILREQNPEKELYVNIELLNGVFTIAPVTDVDTSHKVAIFFNAEERKENSK